MCSRFFFAIALELAREKRVVATLGGIRVFYPLGSLEGRATSFW